MNDFQFFILENKKRKEKKERKTRILHMHKWKDTNIKFHLAGQVPILEKEAWLPLPSEREKIER